jgi:outer membrane protein assembly factor BamB
MTGAPLVDGDRLICLVGGEPDAKLVALDKKTGAEVWRALASDSEPGYSQPTIIDAGGARQLIVFHPKGISSLDPSTGKVYWEAEHTVQMGIVAATPVHTGRTLLHQNTAAPACSNWQVTSPRRRCSGAVRRRIGMTHDTPNTFNSVISTPVIDGDYVYGLDNDGQLRCLSAATGKQVWTTDALLKEHAMYGTAFFVRQGGRYFISNDRGELVIAQLLPEGFKEIDRAKLLDPTHPYVRRRQMPNVLGSHRPTRTVTSSRNDNEIILCVARRGS